ncbi:hypothetical protein SAMN04515671_0076 [Nakamurella panacisegetis]|uniref:Uncharacterized protein n=1 Tax=Nakamurella panacisegetis TaxID=1090615 RepID=A0A1H0HHR3_9ACTN|nr:hypothetical protein SAMN04515671_0076 [Nakamurella panacisegetis]
MNDLDDDSERIYAFAVVGWDPDTIDWGSSEPAEASMMSALKEAWHLGYAAAVEDMRRPRP